MSDALENTSHGDGSGDLSRQILVLDSFDSILKSLEKIVDCETEEINEEIVEKIFQEFPYLESADYEGLLF